MGTDGRGRRRSHDWDRWYKQTQFADTDRERRGPAKSPVETSLRPTAPNKPNLPPTGRKGAARSGRRYRRPWGKHVKRSQFPAGGHQWARAGKVAPAAAAGPKRAKQSQFRPACREGQVPFPKRVMTNWRYKRPRRNKANFRPDSSGQGPSRLPAPPVGPGVPNKANVRRTDRKRTLAGRAGSTAAAGDKRAKRSQFPESGQRDGSGTDNCQSLSRGAAGRRKESSCVLWVARPKGGPNAACRVGEAFDRVCRGVSRLPEDTVKQVWPCHPDPPLLWSPARQSATMCRPQAARQASGKSQDLPPAAWYNTPSTLVHDSRSTDGGVRNVALARKSRSSETCIRTIIIPVPGGHRRPGKPLLL